MLSIYTLRSVCQTIELEQISAIDKNRSSERSLWSYTAPLFIVSNFTAALTITSIPSCGWSRSLRDIVLESLQHATIPVFFSTLHRITSTQLVWQWTNNVYTSVISSQVLVNLFLQKICKKQHIVSATIAMRHSNDFRAKRQKPASLYRFSYG